MNSFHFMNTCAKYLYICVMLSSKVSKTCLCIELKHILTILLKISSVCFKTSRNNDRQVEKWILRLLQSFSAFFWVGASVHVS